MTVSVMSSAVGVALENQRAIFSHRCRLATLKLDYPELRWYVWKSTLLFGVSGAFTMAHENLSERYFTPVVIICCGL
jgi:hypothetical protein